MAWPTRTAYSWSMYQKQSKKERKCYEGWSQMQVIMVPLFLPQWPHSQGAWPCFKPTDIERYWQLNPAIQTLLISQWFYSAIYTIVFGSVSVFLLLLCLFRASRQRASAYMRVEACLATSSSPSFSFIFHAYDLCFSLRDSDQKLKSTTGFFFF